MQGGPGVRASLPQHMKANMLTTTAADADLPRKVVIAYDSFDVGRQMLTWAAKYCLAAEDQMFLLQYQVWLIALKHPLMHACMHLPTHNHPLTLSLSLALARSLTSPSRTLTLIGMPRRQGLSGPWALITAVLLVIKLDQSEQV